MGRSTGSPTRRVVEASTACMMRAAVHGLVTLPSG